MKKMFLLVLLFHLTIVFGQYGVNGDCAKSGCGDQINDKLRCWGSAQTFSDMPGITVRVKGPIENCFNAINDEPNRHSYQWWIEVKGSTNVLFRVDVSDSTGKTTNFGGNKDGECIYPFEITQKDIQDANEARVRTKGNVWDFKTFSNSETINVRLIRCSSSFKGKPSSNETAVNQTSQQQQAQPQNDLTGYNRSKAEMEQKMQQQNAENQRQSAERARQNQQFTNAYNEGVDLGNNGKYTEAKAKYQQAISVAPTNEQRQQAQNAYDKINKAGNQAQAINQLTTTAVDLLTYFQTRKNALRNALSNEDGQALINIANAENPTDYTQNIIQIFTDLGYTYRKAETKNGMTSITMNNDVGNINDLLFIFIHPASYDFYHRISFDYHRKKKLQEQLSVLGSKLKDKGNSGFELQGISPGNRQKEQLQALQKEQNKIADEQKLLMEVQNKKVLKDMESKVADSKIDAGITIQLILDKYFNAVGGYENIKSVSTISFFQENEDRKSKAIIGYGKTLEEGTFKNKEFKFVFDGIVGYQILNSVKSNLSEYSLTTFKKLQPFEILGLQQSEFKMGSIEIIGGMEYYSLIAPSYVIGSSTYAPTYYFDKKNGLLKGKKIVITGQKYIYNQYKYYEDYRSVNGMLFPYLEIDFVVENANSLKKTKIKELKINEPNIKFE